MAERAVGVVGLGYVGLPLAVAYAEDGFPVTGFDVDPERVATLMAGHSHIDDVTSQRVAAVVDSGRFTATAEAGPLGDVDALFICVPTPFDRAKTPDLSYVRAATHSVASVLKPGMLVILQSTTYPGTTTEVVQPILEAGGLVAGRDFNLAFSPERVDPGNARWTVRTTPKVVGGITPRCAERARDLLASIMGQPHLVTILSSPVVAEMAKLLENTYRAVNIALVNELAQLSHEMGIDIWEVIDAAATKPFGFQPFYPGAGAGGHCIPVDPYYLSWKAREFDFQTKFIELAADTNLRMAHYVVQRIVSMLNRHQRPVVGAHVLALGAAFKPGVSDIRNSRAIRVMELLADAGADVSYADPHVPSIELLGRELKAVPATTPADAVVVLVAHADWTLQEIVATGTPVFDVVNASRGLGAAGNVEKL